MRFIVPSPHSKNIIESDSVPVELSRHALPGAVVHHIKSDWGNVLSQYFSSRKFGISQYVMKAFTHMIIHVHYEQSVIMLLIVTEFTGIIPPGEEGALSLFPAQGFARMVYVPKAKEYKIELDKNSSAVIYAISFKPVYLRSISCYFDDKDSIVDRLLNSFETNEPETQKLEDVLLSKDQVKVFQALQTELNNPGGNKLWLLPQIKILLRWYLLNLDSKKIESSIASASFPVTAREIKAVIMVAVLITKDVYTSYSITALANVADMPIKKLRRIFKHYFNLTIHQFRQHKIMEEAAFLLLEKRMTIKETSYTLGYAATSDFTKAFKKFYGLTPRQMQTGN